MSYILLYVPICLVILSVLETIKEDQPSIIVKHVLKSFAILTGMLIAVSAVIFLVNKYL